MGTRRNQQYIVGQKYYLPERVFFSNLLQCCECKPKAMFERITATMQREIEIYIKGISSNIEYIEKRFPKDITAKTEHLLPGDFSNFVNEYCRDPSSRKRHYLLLECYQRVQTAVSWINNAIEDICGQPKHLNEDKETLNTYKDCIRNLSAVTEHEYYRIKATTYSPTTKKSSRISSYSVNQNEIVRFTMEKVIPEIIIHSERQLLSAFSLSRWHELIFESALQNGDVRRVIRVDSTKSNDFVKDIKAQFILLDEIAQHHSPEEEIKRFGEILMKILDLLAAYHQNGTIYGFEAGYVPSEYFDSSNLKELPVDDELYTDDSLIAIHIIHYLNYLNLYDTAYTKTLEFMEALDEIIDRIRPQVLEQIGRTITKEEFSGFEKVGYEGNSLFLWPCCSCLTRLLFKALLESVFFGNVMKMGG